MTSGDLSVGPSGGLDRPQSRHQTTRRSGLLKGRTVGTPEGQTARFPDPMVARLLDGRTAGTPEGQTARFPDPMVARSLDGRTAELQDCQASRPPATSNADHPNGGTVGWQAA